MAFIRTIPPSQAEGPVREMYQQINGQLGFVPNWAQAFSLRPGVRDGWIALLKSIQTNLPVRSYELAWYLSRLEDVRRRVLAAFRAMDLADYRRVRRLDYADITPEWTLHHLMQHEAEHRGELAALRARAEAAIG